MQSSQLQSSFVTYTSTYAKKFDKLNETSSDGASIRIVGLSATLPNYNDVASFLHVDRMRGLFVFDSSYRPVPLKQTFCAVKKMSGVSHSTVLNKIVYSKVLQTILDNEQIMIFVHSRRETEHTAMYIKQQIVS